VVVFRGVGIRKTTLVAESLALKLVLMVMTYETREVPISVTVGMMRSGNFTLDVARYLKREGVTLRKKESVKNKPH